MPGWPVPVLILFMGRFLPGSCRKEPKLKVYSGANIRNIALVGHGHAGKTTLASAMLYTAGEMVREYGIPCGIAIFPEAGGQYVTVGYAKADFSIDLGESGQLNIGTPLTSANFYSPNQLPDTQQDRIAMCANRTWHGFSIKGLVFEGFP